MADRIPPDALAPFTGPVFMRAKVGLCVTDEGGRVVAVNPEATRMFQMTAEEILGHSFLIFVPKNDRRNALRSFQAVIDGGYMDQPDWFVRVRSGGHMWVRVSPALIDLEGGYRAVMSVLTDVTPSRTAEAAQQRAEYRARSFMESNVIGVMEWLPDGRIVEINPSLSRLLGTSYADLGSLTWQQLTPSEYVAADRAALAELATSDSCQPYAKEFVTATGGRAPVFVASSRLPLEEERFVTYVLDRTESRAVEIALRESERTLQRILDTALDSVVLLEPDGTIRSWFGASESMLGYSAAEAVGRDFFELLIPNRYLDLLKQGIASYISWGEGAIVGSRTELEVVRADGVELPVELSISAATTEGRTIFCAFLHDLKNRRLAEARIRDMNRILEARVQERTAELEAAVEELEGFSYSVSHDLRAPLRGINGFATLLLNEYRDQLGSDGIEHIQRITVSTKRMARLIDDLLGFARLARVEVKRQTIDFSKMATETCQDVAMRWSHPVEVHVEPGLTVSADQALLRLILTNLIENAWKFTSKTAHARVDIGHDPERGFFVRDNGAGFDPAFTPRLFRPFERLHASEDFPGSGIGLANVERVVRRHGGKLSADGCPDKGATFSFTLD